ncbi:glycerol-3-phosphate acyltransferase PlsY [Persephonella hydrogeniphila]|uniref:Glycerol-3-phosphate acyltransferase n=1 Tax=Persephonella hydrogeniphila TaxID=198703 RepID=A0A285MYW2_9AQUI|nr:glycerol-3-phosphate 1-O-acyltransferase PlsY [Persephonella hydrogeniphila]SNZ02372.1 glycerol-3-phosphate acyltransferase PlsY [Persephonella hydrogeniphila]
MKILYLTLTYLIASIPFGYIIGKIFGKDVTKEGSGNIGATNVARTIGKKAGVLVLTLDMLKGFIPVFLAKNYFFFDDKFVALVAITAVVGHCYSVFMKFKGGKGVATGIGVLLALSPKVALIVILLWAGIFLTTGYVSLASIISAFMSWIMMNYIVENYYYTLAALLASFIIIYKHSSNIERLIKGTEHRFIYK